MQRLLFREWFIVVSCLSFIFALFLMETFSSSISLEDFPAQKRRVVQVIIDGAVERPGVYVEEVGATVKSVLEKAGLKKNADVKSLYLQKKLLNSCALQVFEKKPKKDGKKKKDLRSMDYPSGLPN